MIRDRQYPVHPPMPWAAEAACRDMGPAVFFVERNSDAKAVCAGCPVQAECLAYALTHNERHGVWGGTSERQRQKLRRKLRKSR